MFETIAAVGLLTELLGYVLIGGAAWAAVRVRARRAESARGLPQIGEPLPQKQVERSMHRYLGAASAAGFAMMSAAFAMGLWRAWG